MVHSDVLPEINCTLYCQAGEMSPMEQPPLIFLALIHLYPTLQHNPSYSFLVSDNIVHKN
jgi:hypothetical protein